MNAASKTEYAHDLPRQVQDARVSTPSAHTEDMPPALSGDPLCQVAGLECRVFSNLSEVAIHWRNLEQSAWLTPFQQYFWSTSASSSRGDDRTITPQIVVGFQSGIPKLLLPFAIETRWFTRRLVWLGQRFNDYNAPIIDRRSLTLTGDAYARIVESVASAQSVDAMHLIRKPVDNSMPSYGEALDAEYASHVVDLSRDWNATYRQLRSSRSRQRIRSKMKALRQGGRVSFRKLRNPVEKSREAHQILEWKSEQLDSLGKTNPFRVRESGLSRAIFVAIGDMNGNLEVYGLFHDDVMVAGMIAFVDDSCFSLLVTAYDEKGPSSCSPGIILLVKTIELCSRAGLNTYDFLIGDESYKLQWSKRTVPILHHVHAFNAKGAVFCHFQKSRLRLKKWMLARPWAMTQIRSLNRSRVQISRCIERMGRVVWPPH